MLQGLELRGSTAAHLMLLMPAGPQVHTAAACACLAAWPLLLPLALATEACPCDAPPPTAAKRHTQSRDIT